MAENNANEEKMFLTLSGIGAIFGFIIPLVVWILRKEDFSEYTKKFILDILNFELVLFIACVILTFIPVLGWMANLGIWIFNLIVVLGAYSAAQEQKEYNLPIKIQIIK